MTYADLSPLANHLWQSTIFGTALSLLTLAFRKNRAAVRYWIWLAASIKFLIPFSVLVGLGHQLEWRSVSTVAQPQITKVLNEVSQPFVISREGSAATAVPISPSYAPPGVLCIWLCGAFVGLVFWVRLQRRMHAVVRASTPLQVKLPITVLSCSTRVEPGVFGIWKPVLVLPTGIADALTPAKLEGILAHELCHVRRRDNLTAAIHMIAEVIFWFHPMVWWIRTQLVKEREQACDEAAVQGGSQPQVYAEAILDVCKFYLESPLVCVSGVTGGNLKRRIQEIIANQPGRNLNRSKQALLASVVLASLFGPITVGVVARAALLQESDGQQRLTFEVASVKPDPPSQLRHVLIPPVGNRFSTRTAPLGLLIQNAYGVNAFQIVGGPDWMNSSGYDIEAKAAGNPTRSQIWLMLRSLLEDRFKLKIHRETKLMPIYSLTIARGGPKLPKSVEEDCTDPAPVQGQRPPAPCGRITVAFETAAGLDIEGRQVTIAELTRALSAIFQRNVIDQTQLSGRFDVKLKFAYEPDVTVGIGNPWRQGNSGQPEDPGMNPPIAAALRQQLGLSLEPSKGPVEVLIVDQAERPSAN
jgi:bla regulator protein blaR1